MATTSKMPRCLFRTKVWRASTPLLAGMTSLSTRVEEVSIHVSWVCEIHLAYLRIFFGILKQINCVKPSSGNGVPLKPLLAKQEPNLVGRVWTETQLDNLNSWGPSIGFGMLGTRQIPNWTKTIHRVWMCNFANDKTKPKGQHQCLGHTDTDCGIQVGVPLTTSLAIDLQVPCVPQDLRQQSYLHTWLYHWRTAAHPKSSLVRQGIWGNFYSCPGTIHKQATHTVLVWIYWRRSVFVSTYCIHKISQDGVNGVPYQFQPKHNWRRLRPTRLKLEANVAKSAISVLNITSGTVHSRLPSDIIGNDENGLLCLQQILLWEPLVMDFILIPLRNTWGPKFHPRAEANSLEFLHQNHHILQFRISLKWPVNESMVSRIFNVPW